MYIHKEGYHILTFMTLFTVAVIVLAALFLTCCPILQYCICGFFGLITIWAFTFFRVPTNRVITKEENAVVCSADGEVVAIEEIMENEYFHEKKIQISVFMSAYNVHVNWYPIDGVVSYVKYHPGKKLFAINPKSSEFNERNSLTVKDAKGREVMLRQVAGIMARRIVCRVKEGDEAKVGEEFGMIKFGSRVDFFLPVDSTINVKIGDSVRGKISVLAYLK